jgi:PAS domain S-box-containing protein
MKFRKLRKFRTSLGPLEQAQIVVSTAVVVTMITMVAFRVVSGEKIGWYDFVSVTIVGFIGFLIVYSTIASGRQLEEQKQELLALNTVAGAVNRAVEIPYLLQSTLQEIMRLLDVEFGWIYLAEGNAFILKATRGTEAVQSTVIDAARQANGDFENWVKGPRIEKKGSSASASQWVWPEFQSWVSIPILMKDQFFGIIVLASKDREAVTNKHLDLITAFANYIGVAMENAALFERLRKSEERYMDLYEHSPDMYHIVNRRGEIVSVNQTEATRLGYRKDELVGHPVTDLYPSDYHQDARRILREVFENGREVVGIEEQMVKSNGELLEVSVNTSIIFDEANRPSLMRVVARDITERKKLEARVIHAQRIDSIGKLAGGVAHDFNNILTSILGSTSIMKRKMKAKDQWYKFVDIIETAAKRGSGLTRQLLTFARKSTVQFRPVIVNDIVEETVRLFERSVDKTIEIHSNLTREVCLINGDDGQISQALLNLLINARDAMPEGGLLTVSTAKTNFDRNHSGIGESRTGDYVVATIADTGTGMDRRTQQHIFEPFYTTKDQGKGTGLGLAVVYGVVNAHNGFITLQSEPGVGSQFALHFPLLAGTDSSRRTPPAGRLPRGKESVLVVDDELDVREVIGGMLNDLGYKVTKVESGKKALDLYKKKKRFDVVVLDMNMPVMGGKETFAKLKAIDPHTRVIISTGYSNRTLELSPLRDEANAILQKPYQMEELSRTMRSVLEE